MHKNNNCQKQKKDKISSNFISYSQRLEIPLFFCLNKKYINDLQKEANVNMVISLAKYRKLFWKKFKKDLLDYLCLDKFLTDGLFCFDLDRFEEFSKSQGYNKKFL